MQQPLLQLMRESLFLLYGFIVGFYINLDLYFYVDFDVTEGYGCFNEDSAGDSGSEPACCGTRIWTLHLGQDI